MDSKQKKELIEAYASECVESMDMDTLCTFAKESIESEMEWETDECILETIRDYYPHLLEGTEWE